MKIFLICAAVFLTSISGGRSSAAFGSTTVLGDSIASGYGLADYVPGNDYSALDSSGGLLGAECERYENFAVDGRTSEELLAALSEGAGGAGNALERSVAQAQNVIVSIGGNDFLQPMLSAVKDRALTDADFFGSILDGSFKPEMIAGYSDGILRAALSAAEEVDAGKTAERIGEIVKRISEINPRARIFLLTVYNPFAGNTIMKAASDVADEKLSELNAHILALQSESVVVADVFGAFSGNEAAYTNIGRLDIHPNSAGHYKIYELLYGLMADDSERGI